MDKQLKRKLDLIFETLLHIAAKVMEEEELEELWDGLKALNAEAIEEAEGEV